MRVLGFLFFLLLTSCSKDTIKYNAKTYDWCNDIIIDFEQQKKSGLSTETYHWCSALMSESGVPITAKLPPSAPVTKIKVENKIDLTNAKSILGLTKEEKDFEPNQEIIQSDIKVKKEMNSTHSEHLEQNILAPNFKSEQTQIKKPSPIVAPEINLNLLAADQFNLALNYFHGQGVQQDYISAHMLLTLAQRNGEEDASDYKLALTERMTVSQIQEAQQRIRLFDAREDKKQSVNTETREQELAEDPFSLGLMYFQGKGVPQDYVMALMLFNIAATSGNQEALYYRDAVSERMQPAEIRRADALALEWSAQHSEN